MTVAPMSRFLARPGLILRAAGLACAFIGLSAQAAWSLSCKPGHFRPAFFVKTMGACAFDPATLNFRGEPPEQARCLMRGMDRSRNLGPEMAELPSALAARVGRADGLPSRETLAALLSDENLEWDFAAYLWLPLSHGSDNDPQSPAARYFVIHDTSGPNFGHRELPADVDVNRKINSLANFRCPDGWGKAHVVINRTGGMLLNHELSTPWRETKFEQAANFAGALKGLFLHTELIQPRHGRRNAESPNPSFTAVQYDRLALVYVIASVRAGRWLIPAFHAAMDAQIHNGHDDPLNFDVERFADSLQRLADKLDGGIKLAASTAPPRVPWGSVDTTYRPVVEAEAATTSPAETAAPPATAPTTAATAANAGPPPAPAPAPPPHEASASAASTLSPAADGPAASAPAAPAAVATKASAPLEAAAADATSAAQLASTEKGLPDPIGGKIDSKTDGKIDGKTDGASNNGRDLNATAEHCWTHRAKGHHRRNCATETTEAEPRPARRAAFRPRVANNSNPFAAWFSAGASSRNHRTSMKSSKIRFWPQ